MAFFNLPDGWPDHSPLAISAAGIWGPGGNCTGYVQMAAHFPQEETEESREGTAAHELIEPMIRAAMRANTEEPKREDWIGRAASNGVIFTDVMWDGARMYADDVIAVMRQEGVFSEDAVSIEKRVHNPTIYKFFYGRLDTSLWVKASGRLYVWDYKFGHGYVDAYQNAQGIGYALCELYERGVDGQADQHIEVVIRIVQPRNYHPDGPIREWRCLASDLRPFRNIFETNAAEAFSDNAECRTGSHCRNCPARIGCPAALQACAQLFEAAAAPVPARLTPEQLGQQLRLAKEAADRLKKLADGYESAVEATIRGGQNVPGWMPRPKFGRETWKVPQADVIAVGDLLGTDLRGEVKAKTPAQARKLGIDETVIKAYAEKPDRGIAIVEDDGQLAKRIFSK